MLWRIIGLENVMLWIGLYPDEVGRFVERLGEFALGIAKAQIQAAGGLLDGMVIWGDVAYRKNLFFSPGLLAESISSPWSKPSSTSATPTACP